MSTAHTTEDGNVSLQAIHDAPASEPTLTEPSGELLSLSHALGEHTRMKIVHALMQQPLHVNAIASHLGTLPTTVSQHLRILREAGYVSYTEQGKNNIYRLEEKCRRDLALVAEFLRGSTTPE